MKRLELKRYLSIKGYLAIGPAGISSAFLSLLPVMPKKYISDKEMIIIPVIVTQSGYSPGTITHDKIAPKTGMINFHRFSSETFTSGRLRSVYHFEKVNADIKASQIRTSQ